MPLVAYKDLPTFDRLKEEGRTVLPADRAQSQEIREMHIGLLNMMPDAALQATERQFFRLVGESNKIAQFYVHPFTLPELERGDEAKAYISQYYETFEQLQQDGLDALIITGANVSDPDLTKAEFWQPLQDVMDWAWDNVVSTLSSCLATHAIMEFAYDKKRTPVGHKRWGVYKHRVMDRSHMIMRGVNTVFDVPHSRHNQITRQQFEDAGLKVLVSDVEDHVHMAVSPDGFRRVLLQGHPEYDMVSLYKEYKREVQNYLDGNRPNYPPTPENFFYGEALERVKEMRRNAESGEEDWAVGEMEMRALLDNSWADTARSMVGNWTGLVYQLTNVDRHKQFMDGVDPDNPLGSV